MSETTTTILIIAIALVVGLLIFFLRSKIKNTKVKAGGVSFEVGTHEPDRLVVKGIEQTAEKGSNQAIIHTTSATVDGLKQTAQKDNLLDIGNP